MSAAPADLLHYLPGHRVIVCTSCQYALQPTGILRHLKDVHHILRSDRKPYAEHVSRYDLADVKTVQQATDKFQQYPVPELPVFDGLQCLHKGCGHLCVTEKRMGAHWTLKHERMGLSELDWKSVPLQTFFRGNALRYFTPAVPAAIEAVLPQQLSFNNTCIADDEAALMQHYIDTVSLTLADEAPADGAIWYADIPVSLWQQTIPELAKTSTYLRRGILACSALHLAYIDRPHRQEYILAAAQYQDSALPQFRSEIVNIGQDNCNTILAFIHISTICSFAFEPENERLLIVDPSSADIVSGWLSLVRSGCEYVHTVSETLLGGPLKVLLCNYDLGDKPKHIPLPLVERLLSIIPASSSNDAWTDEECEVYSKAVQELGTGFAYANSLGSRLNTWVVLRVWPMVVSIDFLTMLRQEHPGALIALAHYCALLHRLDGKWYAQGRAMRLLGHIFRKLDPKWHAYVNWSIHE